MQTEIMFAERKKNKFEEEQEEEQTVDTEGWQIIYTGFALILLSFFIMLCSYSTVKSAKVMRFTKSFMEAVSILSDGLKLEDGPIVLQSSAEMISADERIKLVSSLKKAAQEVGFSNELQLNTVGNDIYISLPDNILFKLGDAAIENRAYPLLSKIAGIIKEGRYNIRIEGHTDNLPINTPMFPSNWELSTARAVNVLRFLHEKEHIDSNRLSAVGLSEYHPVADNNTIIGRRQNRRVEIILENVAGKLEAEESGITSDRHEASDFVEGSSLPLTLQENIGE